jgi:hypothetical protein
MGFRDALMLLTLAAFSAKTATRTALTAAWPIDV